MLDSLQFRTNAYKCREVWLDSCFQIWQSNVQSTMEQRQHCQCGNLLQGAVWNHGARGVLWRFWNDQVRRCKLVLHFGFGAAVHHRCAKFAAYIIVSIDKQSYMKKRALHVMNLGPINCSIDVFQRCHAKPPPASFLTFGNGETSLNQRGWS